MGRMTSLFYEMEHNSHVWNHQAVLNWPICRRYGMTMDDRQEALSCWSDIRGIKLLGKKGFRNHTARFQKNKTRCTWSPWTGVLFNSMCIIYWYIYYIYTCVYPYVLYIIFILYGMHVSICMSLLTVDIIYLTCHQTTISTFDLCWYSVSLVKIALWRYAVYFIFIQTQVSQGCSGHSRYKGQKLVDKEATLVSFPLLVAILNL